MHQRICSNKEARSLKIRPRGSLQITSNTLLRVQALPARFPPKTRYKRATRRVSSVSQDVLQACNKTRYERAIDAPLRWCNTTRYKRAIDTLLCEKTHYGVRESFRSQPRCSFSVCLLRPRCSFPWHHDVLFRGNFCLSVTMFFSVCLFRP